MLCCRLDDFRHRIADFQRNFQLGACEAFWRILETITTACFRSHVHDHLCGIGRNLLDALDVLVENNAALQFTGRIVEVDNWRLSTFQRFKRTRDQFRAALHQHLQINFVRRVALLNCPAAEVKIGLRSRWEADFDFRETHIDQQAEHAFLSVVTHWVDQCLITVAQIDRTPDWCLFDALCRPGAVIEFWVRKRRIFHSRVWHTFMLSSGIRRVYVLIHGHLILPAY